MSVESGHAIGTENGRAADIRHARDDTDGGAPPRHIDYATAQLDRLARSWIDVQQTRKAFAQRELDEKIVSSFGKAEDQLSRALSRALRTHPLWPWLSQFPGLGGAHTALIIGRIGDPRRYPGQRCSDGHYLPPLYAVGAPCPIADVARVFEQGFGDGASVDAGASDQADEIEGADVCPGVMLPPRPGTGVRSLWHWSGLHAVDGEAPRKRKGRRCDWEPRVRASVMQPGGIAEQIVRLTVPHYSDIYRSTKERLTLRVADSINEIETAIGDANLLRPAEAISESERRLGGANNLRAADVPTAIDSVSGRPLRPFEADRIARKVAAKAFLGDLLTQWKGLA